MRTGGPCFKSASPKPCSGIARKGPARCSNVYVTESAVGPERGAHVGVRDQSSLRVLRVR